MIVVTLSMDELPKHMTFIGVGIISVEFASIMIKSGVEVTMIHHSDKPLKGFNQTHVTQLIKIRRRRRTFLL